MKSLTLLSVLILLSGVAQAKYLQCNKGPKIEIGPSGEATTKLEKMHGFDISVKAITTKDPDGDIQIALTNAERVSIAMAGRKVVFLNYMPTPKKSIPIDCEVKD